MNMGRLAMSLEVISRGDIFGHGRFLCYSKLSSVVDYCNLSTAFRETKHPIRKAKGLRILYYEHLCASSALNSSTV